MGLILTSGGSSLIARYLAASGSLYAPEPPKYLMVQSGIVNPGVYFDTPGNFEIYRNPLTHSTQSGKTVTFHAYLGQQDQRDQDADQKTNTGMTITSLGLVGGAATLASGTGTTFAVASIAPFAKNAITTAHYDFAVTLSGQTISSAPAGGGGTWGVVLTSGGIEVIGQYLAASKAVDAPNPPLYVIFGSVAETVEYYHTSVPGGEIFRKAPINRVLLSGAGALHSVTWSFLLGYADCNNVTINSFGLVGGNATTASGTGTLMFVATPQTGVAKTVSVLVSGNLTVTISGALR